MLGDAAGFMLGNIGFSNVIQKLGFAMVNMAHYNHNGRPGNQIVIFCVGHNQKIVQQKLSFYKAERVGFEPTVPFGTPHFKCGGINRYPTSPLITRAL